MASVVIVNWNSGAFLESSIRSLRAHAPGCRIIVVDNASSDGSLRAVEKDVSDLTIISNRSNRGFAAACNQGWGASEDPCVLFLNPDTECCPGSVSLLQQTLESDEDVWAVGGCLVSPDGSAQTGFNVRRLPTLGSVASEMLFLDELFRPFRPKRAYENPGLECPVDVEQPAAACLMVRRRALRAVGGFDESFHPAWFEDVDLCYRIGRNGGRILYQPNARFLHHGGYSLDRMSGEDFLAHFHRNQIRYFRKNLGDAAAWQVRVLLMAGMLFRSALSFLYPVARNASRTRSAGMFWKAFCRLARVSHKTSAAEA
jgi:N-acetylglucosaminyl-diphospho-decaprenol L-rhamnosyltransferase